MEIAIERRRREGGGRERERENENKTKCNRNVYKTLSVQRGQPLTGVACIPREGNAFENVSLVAKGSAVQE